MIEKKTYEIEDLLKEMEELKAQLYEATSIVEAIKEGSVDALVLHDDGKPKLYSLQSADYTYRILIEKIGEGALSISENGLILYCNDAFSKLLGKPTKAIIGTFLNSYIDSVGKFENIKRAMVTGQGRGEIVLNMEGKKLPVYVSLSSLQPQIPAIGIIVTDLSEKNQHEEAIQLYQHQLEMKVNELNQTNLNLEQFAHVISHDIKEPVRKILTYTGFLESLNKDVLSTRQANALRVIVESTQRLNSLVGDLVKFSFSTKKTEFAAVDLNQTAKEVIEDLELLIIECNADITINTLPTIDASAVQMRQLFSNLLTNSLKYRKKNQSSLISIHSEIVDCVDIHHPNKKFHKIMVKDNGIGMDNRHLGNIFAIFRRLENSSEYSGNGVGLAICKRIMENHSGKIEAESTLNDGSTFNLYFAA